MALLSMADPDLQIRERPAHPDPEITGEGRGIKKNFFRPFGPQFGLKIRGGAGPPRPPPLDLPLNVYGIQLIERQVLPF